MERFNSRTCFCQSLEFRRCPRLHYDAAVFSLERTRFDVDEIKVAVSYASVQSGVASLIPVLHGVVTPMRLLFHCGFFHGPFFAQDARPTHSALTLLNASSSCAKKGLLLIWASDGCRSDVDRGSDGLVELDHGDQRALLSWRRR